MLNYSELRKIYKRGYNVREQNEAGIFMVVAFLCGVLVIVGKLIKLW